MITPAAPTIAHFGLFFRQGNAGDIVLRETVARFLSPSADPVQFNVRTAVDDRILDVVNDVDLVVVGGGGLLWNNPRLDFESGWQWNITQDAITRIDRPISLYAVGDSTFDGESPPTDRWRRSLGALLERGALIGVRNDGTHRSLVDQLVDHKQRLRSQVFAQPCPTGFVRHVVPTDRTVERRPVVSVNVPLDRRDVRYDPATLHAVATAIAELSRAVCVEVACHVDDDAGFADLVRQAGGTCDVVALHGRPAAEIVDHYRSVSLSVGGRAHSLLVPLGVSTPVVGLASHNKIRWLSESWGDAVPCVELRTLERRREVLAAIDDALDRRDQLAGAATEVSDHHHEHSLGVRQRLWDQAELEAPNHGGRTMTDTVPHHSSTAPFSPATPSAARPPGSSTNGNGARTEPTPAAPLTRSHATTMQLTQAARAVRRRVLGPSLRRVAEDRRRIEDERRRIEDERRRIEDERRRIEDERRRLADERSGEDADDDVRAELARMKNVAHGWKKSGLRNDRINDHLRHWLAETGHETGRCLEIGAREHPRREVFRPDEWEYLVLDIEDFALDDDSVAMVVADITSCPQIPDSSYDVVVSVDVMEHIDRPWLAAEEITRILRPGGLSYTSTLFAWRYHPVPIDYWRFTPDCLAFLFSGLDTLDCDFDTTERRRDIRGRGKRDRVPIDALGGFRENWRVHHVGRKPS